MCRDFVAKCGKNEKNKKNENSKNNSLQNKTKKKPSCTRKKSGLTAVNRPIC